MPDNIMRFIGVVRTRGWYALWLVMALTILAPPVPVRAGPDLNLGGLGSFVTGPVPMDINADTMEYDRKTGWISARGNVYIRRTNEVLKADIVDLNVSNSIVRARGNVMFQKGNKIWRGTEFTYNLTNQNWETGAFVATVPPFNVAAEKSARISQVEYILHGAVLSTCTNSADDYHYYVKAREARIVPGKKIEARGVTLMLGGVPVLYSPYWYRNLEDATLGLIVRIGYRSAWGGYLLTGYRYKVNDYFKLTTRIDYRSKRGFALGQDFDWEKISFTGSDTGKGSLQVYGLSDSDIAEDHSDNEIARIEQEQRYRVRFRHSHTLSERAYLMSDFNYQGDPYVLEDFFENDYQNAIHPDNYVTASHRGNNYSIGIRAQVRLNDYYNAVNRLPEITYDVSRQQILESPFYYESRSSLAYLQKVFESTSTDEEYSAVRLDSSHYVYYPTRHFDFLNVIPRAGYRATWYSASVENQVQDVMRTTVATNIVVSGGTSNAVISSVTELVTATNQIEAGSALRNLFELGCEVSFKAHCTWDDVHPLPFINSLRHIIEPYANYTFVPEPDVLSGQLYQFDKVDGLGEVNTIKTGVRNRLQTKRNRAAFDIINSDIYAVWNVAPQEGQESFDHLGTKNELQISDKFKLEFIGTYSSNSLSEYSTRVWLIYPKFKTAVEYRENRDSGSRLITPIINVLPTDDWTLEAYLRYSASDSRIEEHVYNIQRSYDCLTWRLGFKHIPAYTRTDGYEKEDDFRVEFAIWANAFPGGKFGSTHQYRVQME